MAQGPSLHRAEIGVGASPNASAQASSIRRLYHGSLEAVERPLVGLNTGFADLGRGFYVTDDYAVAQSRARSRARAFGDGAGVVSAYEFDEHALPWITLGARGSEAALSDATVAPFGLRFADGIDGIAAWMGYIKACRSGHTALEGAGEPAVVRAWIATDEVEMVCTGLVTPEELADCVDPSELVVQYCFRDQGLIDGHLAFVDGAGA